MDSIKAEMMDIICNPTHEIPILHRLVMLTCSNPETIKVATSAQEQLIENAVIWRSKNGTGQILVAIPNVETSASAIIDISGEKTFQIETGPVEQFEIYIMPTSFSFFGYFTGLPEHIEAGKAIAQAIDLIKALPDYKWNAVFTRAMDNFAEKYPNKMLTAHKLYREGLLTVSPYWTPAFFENYDAESQIRQLTEAQGWLKENLGSISHVAMSCDGPGFDPQQPQIFKQAGINFYWRSRYTLYTKEFGSPYIEHIGVDGTKLPCFVSRTPISEGYTWPPVAEMYPPFGHIEGKTSRVSREAIRFGDVVKKTQEYITSTKKICGVNFNFHFNTGDQSITGDEQVTRMEAWNNIFFTPKIFLSTIEKMADKLMANPDFRLDKQEGKQPTWAPSHIAGPLALPFQEVSNVLCTAEKSAAFDLFINSTPYPKRELQAAWLNVLDEQQSAQLGHAVQESIQNSRDLINRAVKMALNVTRCSLQRIASKIVFRGEGQPVTVFNLLNWKRKDVVEIKSASKDISVRDTEGNLVPFEISNSGILRFLAEVDGLGYNTYYIRKADAHIASAADLKTGINTIENAFYRLKVDPGTGCVTELFDKELGATILEKGTDRLPYEFVVHEDSGKAYCSFWPTGRLWRSGKIEGAKVKSTASALSAHLMVERPLLSEEGEAKVGKLLRIEYELLTGQKRLDIKIVLDWDSGPKREIRLFLPLALDNPKISYDTLFSTSDYDENLPRRQHLYTGLTDSIRDENDNKNFKLFDYRNVKRFVSVYEKELDIGITLTPPHGLLRVEHGSLSFTLVEDRTTNYVHMMPGMKGRHIFYTSLTSHRGDWKINKAWRFGWEHRGHFNEMVAVPGESLYPFLPEHGHLAELYGENLVLTTLKKSRAGENLIVRVYDAAGNGDQFGFRFVCPYLGHLPFELGQVRNGAVTNISESKILKRIRKPLSILEANETNLLEDKERDIDLEDLNKMDINIDPYKILTACLIYEKPDSSWVPTYEIRTGDDYTDITETSAPDGGEGCIQYDF